MLAAALALQLAAGAPADTLPLTLRQQITAIAQASGATLGVTVQRLEDGERWSLRGSNAAGAAIAGIARAAWQHYAAPASSAPRRTR